MNTLYNIFIWWLMMVITGLAVMPLTIRIFSPLPKHAYLFSKALGLLIISILVWFIGTWNYSNVTIFASFFIVTAACWTLELKHCITSDFWNKNKCSLFYSELLFILLFGTFIFLRSYNPNIFACENFMDMSFLTATSKATSFPINDPWMAGEKLTCYYYLGYIIHASMIKLSGTSPAIGYNLALCLTLALSGYVLFGVLYSIIRKWWVALGGVFIICFLGNLEAAHKLLTSGVITNESWWDSSRIIAGTITEFPIFSFLVGDLHPHVMSIPYSLTTLGFALNHLQTQPTKNIAIDWMKFRKLALWGLVIGSLGMINSWDLPIYLGIAYFSILIKYSIYPDKLISILIEIIIIFCMAFLPFIPFYLKLDTARINGLGWTMQKTDMCDFLLIFGLFAFMNLVFLAWQAKCWLNKMQNFIDKIVKYRATISIVIIAGIGVAAGEMLLVSKLAILLLIFIWLGIVLLAARRNNPVISFILMLLLVAVSMIVFCEIFHIREFHDPNSRANTVFKFYYPAWYFLGISGLSGFYFAFRHFNKMWIKLSLWTLLIILLEASVVYTIVGLNYKTNKFKVSPTLDGLAFLSREKPGEYDAMQWLRKNASFDSVILEAVGPDYSEFSRVSSYTGLPAVLGQGPLHEALWRGNAQEIERRFKEVETIYNSNEAEAKPLLLKYNVRYVYIGSLEHKKYSATGLEKFGHFLKPVFINANVKIYSNETAKK